MSSHTPDSNTESSTQGDHERSPVRFTLHETTEEHDISPVDPVKAVDYSVMRTGDSAHVRRFNQKLFHQNVYAADAMTAGWIIQSPVSFRVEEVSRKTYDIHGPEELSREGIVELEELDGAVVVMVNTLWNVEFPTGYAGLLTQPFVDIGDGKEATPQRLPSEEGRTELRVMIPVNSEFTVARGDGIGQLLAIPEQLPTASYRTTTETEESEIQKERRRRSIYPGTYPEGRDQNRSGNLQRTD